MVRGKLLQIILSQREQKIQRDLGLRDRDREDIGTTQNKEGLLNISIEPQDTRLIVRNYIILCDEKA